MLKLIIAFATLTVVNAVTINTTSYTDTAQLRLEPIPSLKHLLVDGLFKGSGASGYAKQNMCAFKVGDNYVVTQTQGCNSDCLYATYNTTFTVCHILTHSQAGTPSSKILNPAAANELCSSSPSPAPSDTGCGTRYRHQFGFLTFVVITVLYFYLGYVFTQATRFCMASFYFHRGLGTCFVNDYALLFNSPVNSGIDNDVPGHSYLHSSCRLMMQHFLHCRR